MQKPSVLNKPLYKVIFFEFTGTLLFTYGIALSGLPGYPSDVFVSASLFLAICWAGELTGGHFNPAVTIGIKTANGLQKSWAYIVSQYTGGFLGALLAYYISRGTIVPYDPSNAKSIVADVFAQLVGTFAFVSSILIVTTKATTFAKKTLYVYTFIPISLFICRRLSDGAGVNPAVTVMGSLVNVFFNNGSFKYFWIQGIPPIFGGIFAGLFFKYFYLPMSNYCKTSRRLSA